MYHSILEVGPEFKVIGRIDASLEVSDIEASVNLKYDLSGVNFDFLPQDNSQAASGTFTRGTSRESPAYLSFGPHLISLIATPRSAPPMFNNRLTDTERRQLIDHDIVEVTASTNPDVGLTFEATGHLIPQVDVGLTAFSIIKSSVFLNLDASADFTIVTSTANDAHACASANTTLDVGVGAQASFFHIFGASVSKSLFNESFPLLQVRITTSFSSFTLNDDHDGRTNVSAVRRTRAQTGTLPLLPARPSALTSEWPSPR